jgi:DNA repair protein RadC
MTEHSRLKNLPLEERPRERLIHAGPEHLAIRELIAIILRTGSTRRTVIELADDLLTKFNNLRGVARASVAELATCHGMGEAKAVQLKAAFELGRRALTEHPAQLPVVRKPADVYDLLKAVFQDLDREHFRVILLNVKNQVIKVDSTTIGMLNSSPVHPREVFKEAIRLSSASIILAHNHPSGDPTPSPEDLRLTARLSEAGEIIGITIIDHIICGDNCFISLKEAGHLG